MASEFRQEDERDGEGEDECCSLEKGIPPTLSLLFRGLLTLLFGFGLLGIRSWDMAGLGWARFFRRRLTVCRI